MDFSSRFVSPFTRVWNGMGIGIIPISVLSYATVFPPGFSAVVLLVRDPDPIPYA